MSNTQFIIHSPRPTGSCGIMQVSDVIVDGNRMDPHTGLSHRKLALDIWLPTDQSIQLTSYDARALDFWRTATFWTEKQEQVLNRELNTFGQYSSFEHALLQYKSLLPVVIFSHGFGAWASFYSYLIEEIVSHKIAVIGINHTYQAGIAQFSDETIFGKMSHADLFKSRYADAEQTLMLQDLECVISKLKTTSPPYSVLNPNNLVVMGQSLGGSTAVHASMIMSHLRGCVNLDGAIFGKQPSLKTCSPLLLLLGGESINSMQQNTANVNLVTNLRISIDQANDFRECYLSRLEQIFHRNHNVEKVVLEGVDHIGFTDFVFLKKSKLFEEILIGKLKSDEIILKIRKQVLHFLHKVFF